MEKLLSLAESQVWDFPKILDHDDSIVKYDTTTIYEEHHGMGTLENADKFHFMTKNEDRWLLPSESYLLVQCRLRKTDGTQYAWQNVAAVGAVAAVVADDVTINDNGFNLFEKAKYYIDDQNIESIDYLGVSTFVDNILTYTDDMKEKNVKHSQLWFRNDDIDRRTYVRDCQGTINLLLPLNRIFTFCKHSNHVFRGVKHRLEFSLNDSMKTVLRANAVDAGKVQVMKMRWIMPYVEPSIEMMAKLEQQLAAQSTFRLMWPAMSVFRHQPALTQEIRTDLNATVHKPTKIFILTQHLNRTNNQEHDSLEFDHMNLTECFVEVNGVKFPESPIKTDFNNRETQEAYNNLIKMSDGRVSCINAEMFRGLYPIMAIDVSQHQPELYASTTFPNIVINMKYANIPAEDYVLWVVVYNEREAKLSLDQKKMRIIM